MRKKVLVVDDNAGIRDGLTELLKDEGYKVFTCDDAKEVYASTEKNMPDIILLDVFLSGYDGRKICKQLKNDKKTAKIPIIIMSAHHLSMTAIRQYKANDYIEKPYNATILIKKIEKNLKPAFSLLSLLPKESYR